MKIKNKSFKNKTGNIYIDITRTDGRYNLYVYDWILLRDVFSKQGMSKQQVSKLLCEMQEKHNAYIEV